MSDASYSAFPNGANSTRQESWRVGRNMRLSRTFSSSHIPKKNPVIGHKILRHLFLLSFAWQVANVVLICVADKFANQGSMDENYDIGVAFMLFFQLLHLVFVIVTSIKLCKQVLHKTASPLFVVQSFLSTIFLFAGLYTLLHRIMSDCFYGFSMYESSDSALVSLQIFIKFLYFSTATMTTVGYGDVTATMWYTQLLVTCEMLLSVTYTVVIFAQGLSHFNPAPTSSTDLNMSIPLRSPLEAEGLSHFNTPLVLEQDDESEDAPFISKKTPANPK